MTEEYSFNASMYLKAPGGIERLDSLVDGGLERLKLYQVLEQKENITAAELKVYLKNSPLRFLLEPEESESVLAARKMDDLSHWVIRPGYVTQSALFIKNELCWFKLRFENMSYEDKKQFMLKNNFVFPPLDDEVKSELNLEGVWFKFYFTEVPALVKLRLYPLRLGYIYIPEDKLIYWLLNHLEYKLKASFKHMKEVLPLTSNDQLDTILSMLDLSNGPSQASHSRYFDINDLDEKIKHFPLCMKVQHETLQKTHHLKYFSRMQYGLFLKGLGVPLEQALEFWKSEFVKTMPERLFWRKYAYLFKHQYGTVGSKIDYQAYSCDKILDIDVMPEQINGCPYKHWDAEFLRKRLQQDGVSSDGIDEIIALASAEKYTTACTRNFRCLYKCGPGKNIDHPNQYYEAANKCMVDIEDLFESE